MKNYYYKISLLGLAFLFFNLTANGQNIQVHTLTELNASGGISKDSLGHIYISDFGAAFGQAEKTKVYRIDKKTLEVSVFAEGFTGASGACFDSKGNFYQSNPFGHQISKRLPTGEIQFDWASDSLNTPVGVVANSKDEIYACSCADNRIVKVNEAGEVRTFSSDTLFACPNGLTVDEADNLYACNFGNGRVLKITPDGKVSEFVRLPELTGGPSVVGTGHLTYANGRLYVTTIGTGQVFEVSMEGEAKLLAGKAFGFSNNDGTATEATFSKPNGIIATTTGDTLFINCSVASWITNHKELHPVKIRMVTGVKDE